jgi:hypothetical protein
VILLEDALLVGELEAIEKERKYQKQIPNNFESLNIVTSTGLELPDPEAL